MKYLLTILLFFIAHSYGSFMDWMKPVQFHLLATNWYFANAGNDVTGNGSIGNPFRTISKCNLITLNNTVAVGDSILFNRGDNFNDTTLLINKSGTSGNPIVYGAYGTGNKPILSSFYTITTWTNMGANIWQSEALPVFSSSLYIVLINGSTPVGMGRTPNTGWATSTAVSGTTQFTDNTLSASPDWTGAAAVLRTRRWIIDADSIISFNTSTKQFTLSTSSPYTLQNGWGYFIQNSLSTLDQQNEWFYDKSTNRLTVYSSGAPVNVQVATRNNNVSLPINKNYITFSNLNFSGCNDHNITSGGNIGIQILNCTINNTGNTGIYINSSTSWLMQDDSILNSLNNGINHGYNTQLTVVRRCYVKNTSLIPGLGRNGDGNGNALIATSKDLLVEYSTFSKSGYCDVIIPGNSISVLPTDSITLQYNVFDSALQNKNDGAVVYCGTATVNEAHSGRWFRRNYIGDVGTPTSGTGTPVNSLSYGLYCDAQTTHGKYLNAGLIADSNWIQNTGDGGFFLGRGTGGVSMTGNTIVNPLSYGFYLNVTTDSLPQTFNGKRNIVWGAPVHSFYILSDTTVIPLVITWDSTYYEFLNTITQPFRITLNSVTTTYYTFTGWKAATGFDANALLTNYSTGSVIRNDFNATQSNATPNLSTWLWTDAIGTVFQTTINPLIEIPYTGNVALRGASTIPPATNGGKYPQGLKGGKWN